MSQADDPQGAEVSLLGSEIAQDADVGKVSPRHWAGLPHPLGTPALAENGSQDTCSLPGSWGQWKGSFHVAPHQPGWRAALDLFKRIHFS